MSKARRTPLGLLANNTMHRVMKASAGSTRPLYAMPGGGHGHVHLTSTRYLIPAVLNYVTTFH